MILLSQNKNSKKKKTKTFFKKKFKQNKKMQRIIKTHSEKYNNFD